MSLLKATNVQLGSSATASLNFHWRNLLDGLLRLTRGNSGTPIDDVMRIKADNSVEFPAGISGGFAVEYVSPEQVITNGGTINLLHNLGRKYKTCSVWLICKTAEHGYAVDTELEMGPRQDHATASFGFHTRPNGTTGITVKIAGSGPYMLTTDGVGNPTAITAANWRMVVRAWA